MAELKGATLNAYLTSGQPAVPVLIVFGPDPGLVSERCQQACSRFLGNEDPALALVRLSGADLVDSGTIMDEVGAVSMFTSRRVVWVRDLGQKKVAAALTAAADHASPASLLIVEAGDLRKGHELRKLGEKRADIGLIACYPDKERDLNQLIDEVVGEHQLDISKDARRALHQRLGSNRLLSRNELEKLCLYAAGGGRIDFDQVEAMVGDSALTQIDDLVDAVALGQPKMVQQHMRRALADGVHPSVLAGACQRHFQRLELFAAGRASGASVDSLVAGARPPIFFNRRSAVSRQISLWSVGQARAAQQLLQACVLDQRRHADLDDALLGQNLLRLARSKARSK